MLLDLEDIAGVDIGLPLPPLGLVKFFYDAEEQPWGYDPQLRAELLVGLGFATGAGPDVTELRVPEQSLLCQRPAPAAR